MSAKVPRLTEVKYIGMADWAGLQTDILGVIIRKLPIPDYLRFHAVCTSWNHVCDDVSNCPRADPWLMFPPDFQGGAVFFSIPERKNQSINIPSTSNIFGTTWSLVGSSHGWLIYFNPSLGTMQLVNPINGAQFELPPIGSGSIYKAMLLDMNDRSFTVAVIYGNRKGYKVTRKGSNSWSSVQSKHGLVDVLKHRRQLYTIDIYGTIELWAEPPRAWPDEDAPHVPHLFEDAPHMPHLFEDAPHMPHLFEDAPHMPHLFEDAPHMPQLFDFEDALHMPHLFEDAPHMPHLFDDAPGMPHVLPLYHPRHGRFTCLAETPAGDLIRVKRESQNNFSIWILDKGTSSWLQINNIGEFTLFVSHYSSVCLRAKEHPNVKANCVYLMDIHRNVCAFNLENGIKELVEVLPGGQPDEKGFLWFIPSLK